MKAELQVPQHERSGQTIVSFVNVCKSEGVAGAAPVCVCERDRRRERERMDGRLDLSYKVRRHIDAQGHTPHKHIDMNGHAHIVRHRGGGDPVTSAGCYS